MAGSVNKVILVGNLGKDPEVRHFDNGGMVASFPLATQESYFDREKQSRVDLPTDWHNISIRRNGLAKVAESYLKKGDKVYLEGKLRTRTYDKDGVTNYITEVVIDELVMLGGAPANGDNSGRVATQESVAKPAEGHSQSLPKNESDDLPF